MCKYNKIKTKIKFHIKQHPMYRKELFTVVEIKSKINYYSNHLFVEKSEYIDQAKTKVNI